MRRITFLFLAAVIEILFLGQGPLRLLAQSPENVFLISLDQLQADRLHCYGNPRGTSPNIDRLAEQGVRFSHYFTVAPWTAPSYSSVMTSLYPSRHGVTLFWRPGMPLISEKVPMLAEVFRAHGYQTVAFVNNPVAGRELTARGFQEYNEAVSMAQVRNITEHLSQKDAKNPNAYLNAPRTVDHVISWLDEHHSKPFFMFVLLLEPHSPYNPPPEHDLYQSDAYPDQTNTGYDLEGGHLIRLAMLGDQKALERLYELYDGKVHFVDYQVGRLIDHLQKLGGQKNTLFVLTSDHGELLYSHPQDFLTFDHRSVYDNVMHIPYIMAGPNLPQGRVVDALASNVDAAPTILDLVGLPPLGDAQGRSMVPLIEGKAESLHDYVYGEEDVVVPLRSVRNLHYKLIHNLWDGKNQLFNLDRDPGEQQDIAGLELNVTNELFNRLNAWMEENQPSESERLARWKVFTAPDKSEVVDDQTIGAQFLLSGGGWQSDEIPGSGNYNGGCLWTGAGDGSRTALWRHQNPLLGTFKIYIYYGHPSLGRLATNAPFTVVTETGSETVQVNFNQGADQWNLLGTFKNPRYVRVTNAADGVIIADAVKFERVD